MYSVKQVTMCYTIVCVFFLSIGFSPMYVGILDQAHKYTPTLLHTRVSNRKHSAYRSEHIHIYIITCNLVDCLILTYNRSCIISDDIYHFQSLKEYIKSYSLDVNVERFVMQFFYFDLDFTFIPKKGREYRRLISVSI